jgi:hypothetical protein
VNFAPSRPDRVLHDTWAFLEQDLIHLFYLAPRVGDNSHRLIGHATSDDWLHWKEWPFIELTGADGTWDSGRIGTGHTFKWDDGRYYMAYTGRIDPQEDIGLAVSDDLMHWRKVASQPVWRQCVEPPYETPDDSRLPAWRDPYVVREADGVWRAYAAARTNEGPSSNRACVARARLTSPEQWVSLPPIGATGAYPVMEVPEVFEFAGAFWFTFNTHSGWGKRLDTPSRRIAGGTFFLTAPDPHGPWRRPQENLLIGSGEGRRDAAVARSVPYQGERLVYHHYIGNLAPDSPRALGLPKTLDREGDRLILRPWSGLERIWQGDVALRDWESIEMMPWAGGKWKFEQNVVEGRCDNGLCGCVTDVGATDLDLTCDLRLRAGERCGLVLGLDSEMAGGIAVMLDSVEEAVTIGYLERGTYGMRLDTILDRARVGIRTEQLHRLRILKRDRYTDVYLDHALVFSTITGVPSHCGTRLGAVIENGRAHYRFPHIRLLEKMQRS